MTRKSYHHGNLRQALIDAAHVILEARGVAGLSLRRVAQEAGVSATALYSHFNDKRELLALLATEGFERLTLSMQEEAQANDNTGDESQFSLLSLARGYVKFAIGHSALFQVMFGPELGKLTDFPDLVTAGTRSYTMMANCVAREVASSGSPASPAISATAAWSMVHGLSTLLNDGRVNAQTCGVASNDELIQQMCDLFSFSN